MAIDIRDSADFSRLLKRLADDVVYGAIFFRLHQDLRSAITEFERELNQSPAFWQLTLQAHLDAAQNRLGRLYDTQSRALSLRSWLETIRANLHLFGAGSGAEVPEVIARGATPPGLDQVERDLESVAPDDLLVKKLVSFRGNILAHTNARNVVRGRRSEEQDGLTYDEVNELFSRAAAVLNRYSILFTRNAWSTQIIGHNDFRHVLEAIRRDIDRQQAENAAIGMASGADCDSP